MGRFNHFASSIDDCESEVEGCFGGTRKSYYNGESSEDEELEDQDSVDSENEEVLETADLDDDKTVSIFRFLVLFIMIGGIVTAGVYSYKFLSTEEYDDFEHEFELISKNFVDEFDSNVRRCLTDSRNVATTISAIGDAKSTDWPFFTDRNFPEIGSNFRNSSMASWLALTPLVTSTQRDEWKNYTLENQEWVQDSLNWEAEMEGAPLPSSLPSISGDIHHIIQGQLTPAEGSGPFSPVWQMSRAPQDPTYIVNFDALSNPTFARMFDTVSSSMQPVLSGHISLDEFLFGAKAKAAMDSMPTSMLLYPLRRGGHDESDYMVGTLIAVFSWNIFFQVEGHYQIPPIVAVVKDGCGEEFTLHLIGNDVLFVSFGDVHEPYYDDHEVHFKFAPFLQTDHGSIDKNANCEYTVSLYPSNEFYDSYTTKKPAYISGILVGVLLIGSTIFCVYDCMIHTRQQRILAIATHSEKILSVLYPKTIRDRLFGAGGNGDEPSVADGKRSATSYLKNPSLTLKQSLTFTPKRKERRSSKSAQFQMKTIMNEMDASNRASVPLDPLQQSDPIADLFPNATVLFADIAGFTAWSSVREPKHVFTLLETVYAAFDGMAKRRRVFKIETVGDCYVAATGIPDPRHDHAVIMCRFARDCVQKFNELARHLETTLGPDTADLAVRVGIHSGPVTAGVLRGDKSRFQLFGDTVNTAARIESGGKRNKIHLSEETAALIIDAGKEYWLKRREDVIEAKGKGRLQTYWLLFKDEEEDWNEEISGSGTSETEIFINDLGSDEFQAAVTPMQIARQLPDFKAITVGELQATLPLKISRLVKWNVEVLSGLLKQIVAKRKATTRRGSLDNSSNNDAELRQAEASLQNKHHVLDEVVESIPLPATAPDAKDDIQDMTAAAESIQLDSAVVDQLNLYIFRMAAYHKDDNAFHNFEHASHVMMSVSKLLSRIVSADHHSNEHDAYGEDEEEDEESKPASSRDHAYGITSDPMTQFSVILAALIHDVDHDGVSNAQLVKENHQLATLFKHKSVAEQNSIVVAWDTLMEPRFHDLRRCIYSTPQELTRFRQIMTNTVLATDIFDAELSRLRKERWDKAFTSTVDSDRSSVQEDSNRRATIVIEHLIQASDVAHTMQHWHIYRKWNERLFEEMTNAYRAGRMDKNPADFWYQGELAFFDNYIIPLANKLKDCGVFGVSSDEYLNYALANRRNWESRGEKVLDDFCRKHQPEIYHQGASS